MALLGLLLMLGCAAVAVDAVVQNTAVIHAVLFNQPITGLSLGAIFVAGCVIGLLFALGLALFFGGLGRAARIRRERRALRRDNEESLALRERNAHLERRLAEDNAYPNDPATTDTSVTDTGRHRV
ncbi:MAG TPA: hypothetical protein VFJ98_01375 [Mycobacteriales bacterium]|nr:hypothetical protein [Mycobacteriales bacterium]